MWAWSDHVVTKMTSETTLNPNPPVGEKEHDTTPHKPAFVPKDPSYNDFLRRVAPERQKLVIIIMSRRPVLNHCRLVFIAVRRCRQVPR